MEEAYDENIHMNMNMNMMMNKQQQQQQQQQQVDSKRRRDHIIIQEDENSESGTSTTTDTNEEIEDASSSSSSSSSSSISCENGPLFQLTDLMNQLPMRRGLSKHYKGKSQSFTSLAHVKKLQDLAKKVSPYATTTRGMMIKSCKSYAVFADAPITTSTTTYN